MTDTDRDAEIEKILREIEEWQLLDEDCLTKLKRKIQSLNVFRKKYQPNS